MVEPKEQILAQADIMNLEDILEKHSMLWGSPNKRTLLMAREESIQPGGHKRPTKSYSQAPPRELQVRLKIQ